MKKLVLASVIILSHLNIINDKLAELNAKFGECLPTGILEDMADLKYFIDKKKSSAVSEKYPVSVSSNNSTSVILFFILKYLRSE